jgi:uncharacterized Zn finger protein
MAWRKFKMRCPQCQYQYWVELIKEHKTERCPICGYLSMFDDFVEYEVEPPSEATK